VNEINEGISRRLGAVRKGLAEELSRHPEVLEVGDRVTVALPGTRFDGMEGTVVDRKRSRESRFVYAVRPASPETFPQRPDGLRDVAPYFVRGELRRRSVDPAPS
jgi:hypothetical protein